MGYYANGHWGVSALDCAQFYDASSVRGDTGAEMVVTEEAGGLYSDLKVAERLETRRKQRKRQRRSLDLVAKSA